MSGKNKDNNSNNNNKNMKRFWKTFVIIFVCLWHSIRQLQSLRLSASGGSYSYYSHYFSSYTIFGGSAATAKTPALWTDDDDVDCSAMPPHVVYDYDNGGTALTTTTTTNNSFLTRLRLPASGPDATIVTSLQYEMPPNEFEQLQETCNATCQVEILIPPPPPQPPSSCRKDHDNDNNNNNNNIASSSWELQTLDVYGNPKTIGGDEFYISFTDSAVLTASSPSYPTAVAEITDLQNGRYRLQFIESPLNRHRHKDRLPSSSSSSSKNQGRRHSPASAAAPPGVLTVALQYTCGIGNMYPPSKNHWQSGGSMVVREWKTTTTTTTTTTTAAAAANTTITTRTTTPVNASTATKNSTNSTISMSPPAAPSSLPYPPPIAPFHPPLQQYPKNDSDPASSSKTTKSNNPDTIQTLFRNAKTIIPFGDSVMQQFVQPLHYKKPPNLGMCLNTTTVSRWIATLDKRHKMQLEQQQQQQNNQNGGGKTITTTTTTILLVSSSAWDLLESQNVGGLEDHRQAMIMFITHVRQNYPNVTIVWKGPSAVHVHVPMLSVLSNDVSKTRKFRKQYGPQFVNRMRYMSASRSNDLYKVQKQTITKDLTLNDDDDDNHVLFLDVYQASYLSADHTYIGDGRHFLYNLNEMMVHWYITETLVERQWRDYSIKSMPEKKRTLVVAIEADEDCNVRRNTNNTNGNDDDDDDDDDNNNFYLTSLVNAALVAMVSNQRLELRVWNVPQDRECAILSSSLFDAKFQSDAARAITEAASSDRSSSTNGTIGRAASQVSSSSSSPPPKMKRLNKKDGEKAPPLLTLQSLEEQGYIKSSSISKRVAEEFFAQGTTFAYGMILKDLLRWPSSPPPPALTMDLEDSSRNVVVSVQGNQFNGEELKSCLNSLVTTVTRPLANLGLGKRDEEEKKPFIDCHVLFPSAGLARQWEDSLGQYNCSAIAASPPPSDEMVAGSVLSSMANYAKVVADISHDGLITSPSSELFASLVYYLRFDKARSKGSLPISEDWTPECKLNGNATWIVQ